MTQPTQEGAVGGANDTVVAAEPTIEDRLSAALTDEPDEESPEAIEDAPEPAEDGEGEPEITEEDVADEEADEGPPIPPPVSWNAEDKDEFAKLPRAVQETLTRREAEREKFVQTKAQEAAQARSHAEKEALSRVSELESAYAEQLAQYASHFEVQPPDPNLLVTNPTAYAAQLQQHQYAAAQREQAQRQAGEARQRAEQAERELQAREAAEFRATLQEHFPEVLDPANAKLRDDLGSIAREMGYPAELLSEANATDLIALKKASEWRADALKYRTLMAKKMEKVREAKALPQVSRPGVPQGKGAAEASRYAADREAMKRGDKDAELRVLRRFI